MKTGKETVPALLDAAAGFIISYEPGDVMKVSEITGNLEKLSALYGADSTEGKICGKLLALSRRELQGGSGGFTEAVSKGIDLLRGAAETDGPLPERDKKQTEEWLRAGEGTEASVPDGNGTAAGAAAGQEDDPSLIDGDQLRLFVSDCGERFSAAQDLILRLEQKPDDAEAVKELFRIFHTIKGECGFLKLPGLGLLAHNEENLLDLVRGGKLAVDRAAADFLLKGLDLARELTDDLGTGDFAAYAQVPVKGFITALSQFSESRGTGGQRPAAPYAGAGTDAGQQKGAAEPAVRKNDTEDTVIKVRTGRVNYLVDMIGELLICLGQMRDDTEGLPQIRKIARTLQYAGMQLRTESVHALFGTVRRIIRDTSEKVGKQVDTVFEGEDLEIDRTLIESLGEPLMHLVRNAVDHGIESPEERIRAGKKPAGTVRVSAVRRGNNIVISVGDDGQGLDRGKILKKAAEKGLIREKDIPDMSGTAADNLIFVSGFSTNDSVNLVSGRGVGMDIVKEAVTRAKGHITTESVPGKGTTFSLYFPLSTAIIDGMLTRTGGDIFIIPTASIMESLKVKDGQIHKVAEGAGVLDLRGRMIPVVGIAEVFGIAGAGKGDIATIVETVDGGQFAVMSDEILAKREVVIKGLGPYFRNLRGISSGTVLSGGTVGFVLDIEQFIELGRGSLSQEGTADE